MDIKAGGKIVFKKYSEKPKAGEDYLKPGQEYEVVEVNTDDKTVAVQIPNPDFNSKKKESDENPKHILVDVFEEEFTVPGKAAVTGKAKAATSKAKGKPEVEESEEEEDEETEEEAPKAKAKVPSRKEEKAAATKTKTAPKAKTKPAKSEEESEEADPYSDLTEDKEDKDILGLVNEADDILDLARETAEEASATEYKLGGILFHVRKGGEYKKLDKAYAEKGGFSKYVLEQLNVEYRKAMYLIDIYYKWNKFGLSVEKVASIGWAKAAKIAAVMSEDNAEELLELAEENTVADLIENIKANYKEVGGTKGEKKKLTIFKFRLFEESGNAITEVLNSTAAAMSFKSLDLAFEHIVMEWATEHGVAPKAKEETPAKARKAAPTKSKATA